MISQFKKMLPLLVSLAMIHFISCSGKKEEARVDKKAFITENVQFAEAQTKRILEELGEPTGKNYPRTIKDGKLVKTDMYDWTPGFFPGTMWYIYELSGDTIWRNEAAKWTRTLEPLKIFTGHHDLGFMVYCSFGNAERLAAQPDYKDIIVRSAESLCTRYNEKAKVIKSWNYRKTWDETTDQFYPVIIDNMMNLEMLMYASKVSGNDRYKEVAINHANSTMKNHFRDDFSSFHVVDYDTITGNVNSRTTNQGYSDNSTWARGQAWAVYGYTMMYRETKDPAYLDMAVKLANFYLANLPEDLIPYWDFNAGQEGYTPAKQSNAFGFTEKLRDTSAGAIVSSALFELGEFANNKSYIDKAEKMLESLASSIYRAKVGENGNFLIMHSVGSVPHNFEVDAPIVYTDYYFMEALVRYSKMK